MLKSIKNNQPTQRHSNKNNSAVQYSHFDSKSATGGETAKQHSNAASNSTGSIGKHAVNVRAMVATYLNGSESNSQQASIKSAIQMAFANSTV